MARPVLVALVCALLLMSAPGAGADTGLRKLVGDAVATVPGPKPLVMQKVEDTDLAVGDLGPGGGLPAVSVREAHAVVEGAGSLAAAAATAATGAVQQHETCKPYTVHGLIRISNEFRNVIIQDYVSFKMRWCSGGAEGVRAGAGECRGVTSDGPPYRTGVADCWWRGGLWSGPRFSFQTGGTYEVGLGEDPLVNPVAPTTVTIDYASVWDGPGTDPTTDSACAEPRDLPQRWTVSDCYVTATRDW